MSRRSEVNVLDDVTASERALFRDPGATGITFFPGRGEGTHLGYAELLPLIRGAARGLHERGLRAGDRFVWVATSDLQAVRTFLGGLILGAVPIPIAPPRGISGPGAWLAHVEAVRLALRPKALVGVETWLELALDSPLERIACESLPEDGPPIESDPARWEHVQLTSGSTAAPKGVRVPWTHVRANSYQIGWGSHVRPGDVVVSWLPLYHDMGLVGTLLFAIYWNLELVLMSPLTFLRRPRRWLEAISAHRGSLSPAPSFAYGYVAQRVPAAKLADLDLSSWRVAYCGAEPVHPPALRGFAEHLTPAGFRASSLLPCYGLAEATLAVTFTPHQRGLGAHTLSRAALAQGHVRPPAADDDALEVALLGPALPETQVSLRDPSDGVTPTPPGEVGEIWLAGPQLTPGYLDDDAADAQTHRDGWLRTGDLGSWIEGELAVLGRRKELIIVRGRNHTPIDLEWAAGDVEGLDASACCAFAVPGPDG
ncbi:MAG: AMP-binding protein, partial [Planctomycetota bacterium]